MNVTDTHRLVWKWEREHWWTVHYIQLNCLPGLCCRAPIRLTPPQGILYFFHRAESKLTVRTLMEHRLNAAYNNLQDKGPFSSYELFLSVCGDIQYRKQQLGFFLISLYDMECIDCGTASKYMSADPSHFFVSSNSVVNSKRSSNFFFQVLGWPFREEGCWFLFQN